MVLLSFEEPDPLGGFYFDHHEREHNRVLEEQLATILDGGTELTKTDIHEQFAILDPETAKPAEPDALDRAFECFVGNDPERSNIDIDTELDKARPEHRKERFQRAAAIVIVLSLPFALYAIHKRTEPKPPQGLLPKSEVLEIQAEMGSLDLGSDPQYLRDYIESNQENGE